MKKNMILRIPKKINLKNPNVLEKELIRFIEKYNDIIENIKKLKLFLKKNRFKIIF